MIEFSYDTYRYRVHEGGRVEYLLENHWYRMYRKIEDYKSFAPGFYKKYIETLASQVKHPVELY